MLAGFDLPTGGQVLNLNALILNLSIDNNSKGTSVFLRGLKLLTYFGGNERSS